jgi:hypothetical protein
LNLPSVAHLFLSYYHIFDLLFFSKLDLSKKYQESEIKQGWPRGSLAHVIVNLNITKYQPDIAGFYCFFFAEAQISSIHL